MARLHLHHAIRCADSEHYIVAQTEGADLDALAALAAAGPVGRDRQHAIWLAGGRSVWRDVGQLIEALDQRPELEDRIIWVSLVDPTQGGAGGAGEHRGTLRGLAMWLLYHTVQVWKGEERLTIHQVIALASSADGATA